MFEDFNMWFIPFGILLLLLVTFSLHYVKNFIIKTVIVILFFGMLFLGSVSYFELLSQPKPVTLEFIKSNEKSLILSHQIIEEGPEQGIYIWIRLISDKENSEQYMRPFYYVIPYSKGVAQQLQDAMNQAKRNGTGVIMEFPFDHSWEDRKSPFHPIPQPSDGDKDTQEKQNSEPVPEYQRPGQGA